MEMPHLATTTRENSADDWLMGFFQLIDAMDADAAAQAFADDGTFRFGNAEPAVGREQVRDNISEFFAMIAALDHRITGVWSGDWEQGEVKSVEAEAVYTRKDGSRTMPLPVTSTLRMRAGLIQDYRIFMDISPLFALPQEVPEPAGRHRPASD
jgi:ketosteroid isomerase-like protein